MPENMQNINLQIVLAIAGCIALLIGLFGGGVKAKEITIPKLSVLARLFSSLIGAALIWTAIWLPIAAQPVEQPTSTLVLVQEPAPTPMEINSPSPPSTDAPTDMPTSRSTDIPTEAPIPTVPYVPEIIQFGSPDNPGQLNPAFGWQPGNSPANAYDLASSPNALTLIAGDNTHQWAELDSQPMISYPMEGNFETQVKVVFSPMWGHELAALGVRSTQDHNTWLRLGGVYAVFSEGNGSEQHIVLDIDDQGRGGKIKTSPYSANTVYLKIERQGPVFAFYYSPDGNNWTVLQSGYIAEMPSNVEIFLTVGSWGARGISAEFHDFTVLRK